MENLIISKNHLTPAPNEFNLDIRSINLQKLRNNFSKELKCLKT